MDISFHPHANQKLKERGIKESTVEGIIKDPEAVVIEKYGRKIA